MNSRTIRKTIFLPAFLCSLGLFLPMKNANAAGAEPSIYTKTGFATDTVITEKIYTTGEDVTEEALQLLQKLEQERISWTLKSSEIYQINENSGSTMTVSEEMAGYLERILKLSQDSDGAMDPTMGKVIRLWDIDGENPRVPTEDELAALLEDVDYRQVSLSGTELTLGEGTTLDLGAVGKGLGSDILEEFLAACPEVTGAVMNLGESSIMTYGEKPDGSSWQVAVSDPRGAEGDYLGVISLNGTEFLSTSGDYEKYFIEDGIRYHHILDPDTGYPADTGLTAVTVVCKSGLEADGLSTACFVLGLEKGAQLLEKYEADGLFVDDSGHVYATGGMMERFSLLKDSYSLSPYEP